MMNGRTEINPLNQDGPILDRLMRFFSNEYLLLLVQDVSTVWKDAANRELMRRVCHIWSVCGKTYLKNLTRGFDAFSRCKNYNEEKMTNADFRNERPNILIKQLGKYSQCIFYIRNEVKCHQTSEKSSRTQFQMMIDMATKNNEKCVVISLRTNMIMAINPERAFVKASPRDYFAMFMIPEKFGAKFIPFYFDRPDNEANWKVINGNIPPSTKGIIFFADCFCSSGQLEYKSLDRLMKMVPTVFGIATTSPIKSHINGRYKVRSPYVGFYITGQNVSVRSLIIINDCSHDRDIHRMKVFMQQLEADAKNQHKSTEQFGFYFSAYSCEPSEVSYRLTMKQIRSIKSIFQNIPIQGLHGYRIYCKDKTSLNIDNDDNFAISIPAWYDKTSVLTIITVHK